MNIHGIVTLKILLIVASVVTAQFSWGSVFGYRRHIDNDPPSIETRPPRIVRVVDDYYTHPLNHLHLFRPYDPPPRPVIYLPRIHFAPEVHVEERYPYVHSRYEQPVIYNRVEEPVIYSRFEEPVAPLYITRLLTSLSVSYRTRILPVIDYNEDDKETVADLIPSDSNTVVKAVTKNPANESKVMKDDSNVGTNTAQATTPKSNINSQSVTKPEVQKKTDAEQKPEVEKKPEAEKKPETENKPEADKKPENDKTKESSKPEVTTIVPETNVGETKKPAEEEIKKSVADNPTTTEKINADAKGETIPIEKNDITTVDAEVPTA